MARRRKVSLRGDKVEVRFLRKTVVISKGAAMKLNRRLIKITGFVVWVALFTVSVQAQTWSVPLYGCLQGRNSSAVIRNESVLVRTGMVGLDEAITDDITELDRQFDVNVPIYFPNDQMPDAFFTAYKFPELIARDDGDPESVQTGSVFISIGLLAKEARENYGSLMSIPAIIAHEFAHGMQYKNRFPFGGKWRELHADFMAGWFVAHRCRCRQQDPRPAFNSFYNKGDSGFFDPDPHGTKEERVSAMIAGYNYNFLNYDGSGADAYDAGLKYVAYYGARLKVVTVFGGGI